MIYAFDAYRLDVGAQELRRGDDLIMVEPQVFALLRLLIENRERLVSRDEIIERIWNGRIVSDAALDSRVKSARKAIGDDGQAQRLIRTRHGAGFRFIGEVTAASPAIAAAEPAELVEPVRSRPSIAVLPFSLVGLAGPYGSIAEALPHDLIVELSRLRWLFVVARGSSFRFHGAEARPQTVRSALGVRYCLTGSVEIEGGRMTVTVELADTEEGGVIWGEAYRAQVGAVHEIREQIARSVVGALELQIPAAEAQRALSAPQRLDAWSAYHLGLREMYRFDRDGAARAAQLFEQAIAMEAGFARAHAGLSFAHFQGAFLGFAGDRRDAAQIARRWAEKSLDLDPLDPFCNLVMGRAGWLTGDLEGALPWLDRAVELNPNYAQGKYSNAWTRALLGDVGQGRVLADAAIALSPLDPLLYGMLGVRAFSHIAKDETAEAVTWAERAARAPNAHALIHLIAAAAHVLNGDEARGRGWLAQARMRQPGVGEAEFFSAFPFRDAAIRDQIRHALRRLTD